MKKWRIIILLAILMFLIGSIGVTAAETWDIVVSPQKFIVNGNEVKANALNINGYNYVKVAEFAEMLDIDISYNESTNTVAFDKSKSFSGTRIISGNDINPDDSEIKRWYAFGINPNVDYNIDKINNGFMFEFKNKSTEEEVIFLMSDFAGEYKAIEGIEMSDTNVSFSIYQRINEQGAFYFDLLKNRNIIYNDRVSDDTPERRESLSNVLRVYINGKSAAGELAYSQGNGHSDFTFIFDKQYKLEDVKIVRVEVSYR